MARRTNINLPFTQGVGSVDLLAAQGPGTKIKVVGLIVTCGAAAGTIQFTSGTGPTALTAPLDFPINGGLALNATSDLNPILETDKPNEKLSITVTGGPFHGVLRCLVSSGR